MFMLTDPQYSDSSLTVILVSRFTFCCSVLSLFLCACPELTSQTDPPTKTAKGIEEEEEFYNSLFVVKVSLLFGIESECFVFRLGIVFSHSFALLYQHNYQYNTSFRSPSAHLSVCLSPPSPPLQVADQPEESHYSAVDITQIRDKGPEITVVNEDGLRAPLAKVEEQLGRRGGDALSPGRSIIDTVRYL